ncbi:plasmid mobilization relaxosome protein MobC [Ruminococcus sp. NK3A76]|uniref:plasmid mobilization protein n=1 Tax=Ruminococcus sp. NK3A76 TaxID=877411 RepID=UPI0006907BF9|nr:plasmid mobilization relaxosome protein MobC [Ruminococcus sp. NK3A76]
MRKRNKTISIRCTEDEYNRVHSRAEKYGLKLNEFILKTALGRKIIVAEGLADVVRQQKAIGNNLNQLTRLAHEGKIKTVDLKALLDEYMNATTLLAKALQEVK